MLRYSINLYFNFKYNRYLNPDTFTLFLILIVHGGELELVNNSKSHGVPLEKQLMECFINK